MLYNTFFFLFFSGARLFTFEPENITASYGEIVEFRCGVPNYSGVRMEMFVHIKDQIESCPSCYLKVAIGPQIDNKLSEMLGHPGELSANYTRLNTSCSGSVSETCTEGVGKIWMVANRRILNLIEYVYCRIQNRSSLVYNDSTYGYISRNESDCMIDSPNPGCPSSPVPVDVSSTPSLVASSSNIDMTPHITPSLSSTQTYIQPTMKSLSSSQSSSPTLPTLTTCSGTSIHGFLNNQILLSISFALIVYHFIEFDL